MLNHTVYTLYVLDWIQTCLATYDAFQWFVDGWGNIAMLYGLHTSFLNVPICSSLIGAAVQVRSPEFKNWLSTDLLYCQIFFTWRIYTFSRSYAAASLVVVLAFLQLGGGTAVSWFVSALPISGTIYDPSITFSSYITTQVRMLVL